MYYKLSRLVMDVLPGLPRLIQRVANVPDGIQHHILNSYHVGVKKLTECTLWDTNERLLESKFLQNKTWNALHDSKF